ncbi:MAG: hypothetical protein M0C28_18450 [Candidatus Moduliflexus flocculans]|nr:hypothetical protein [Candidatus Moduliflexus flocculans]
MAQFVEERFDCVIALQRLRAFDERGVDQAALLAQLRDLVFATTSIRSHPAMMNSSQG